MKDGNQDRSQGGKETKRLRVSSQTAGSQKTEFFSTHRVADPRPKGNQKQVRKEGRNINALMGVSPPIGSRGQAPCAPTERRDCFVASLLLRK